VTKTEEVRDVWVEEVPWSNPAEAGQEFDRWLAIVKAETWQQGYEASDYEAYHLGTHGRTDNPYRAED
jgi:hypothetical protein